MREAMAKAKVGDDVYEEDPTVKELESHVATLSGKESALYVPSGIMANQIALFGHTEPGDQVICGNGAHILRYEAGAASLISRIQLTQCDGDGTFDEEHIERLFENGFHNPNTSLVALENTHNYGGGIIWPEAQKTRVVTAAKKKGISVHLDGARLWNASIKSRTPLKDLCKGIDTVSLCLSKGLGAPVGSVLCGTNAFIQKARRTRKILGGAMRQVGMLAAAGLFAIKQNVERLSEDHKNAMMLGQSLSDVPGLNVDLDLIQTNILMVNIEKNVDLETLRLQAADRGLLFWPFGRGRIRLVTHKDFQHSEIERTANILKILVT